MVEITMKKHRVGGMSFIFSNHRTGKSKKLNMVHLKNQGWKTTFTFWEGQLFRSCSDDLLNSRSVDICKPKKTIDFSIPWRQGKRPLFRHRVGP